MTEDDFVFFLEKTLSGRYVPMVEWKNYINFSKINNFELSGILELVKFCVTIKGNKIRSQYIMKRLEEYNFRNFKSVVDIRNYLIKHKNLDKLKNTTIARRAKGRDYTREELNSLFTKLEEIN